MLLALIILHGCIESSGNRDGPMAMDPRRNEDFDPMGEGDGDCVLDENDVARLIDLEDNGGEISCSWRSLSVSVMDNFNAARPQ